MNTNEIQQPFQEEEEFGIRDLIRILKTWKDVFVNNIFKILFAGIIGGAIGFAYAYLDTPKYNAQLKFVMRSDHCVLAVDRADHFDRLLGHCFVDHVDQALIYFVHVIVMFCKDHEHTSQ
jgi:hypothetical protein